MWPLESRRLSALGTLGLLCAAVGGAAPSESTGVGVHVLSSSDSLSALQMRVKGDDAEEELDEDDLREEDACEGEEAMASVMKSELKKLQDGTSAWVRLLSKLTEIKDDKQVCTQSQTPEAFCNLPTPEEGMKGKPQLPCGGDDYMNLIGTYMSTKNCVLSLAVTQTLTQNWLGHSGNDGIFQRLIAQYTKALEYSNLDTELYYIYQGAAELVTELLQSAKDALAAFHSLDIKSVLLKRRMELTSLLCALGRGTEVDFGSNVVLTGNLVVIRGAFGEGENEAVAAFKTAVDTFGLFVKALLEEGGFLDRATGYHNDLHKYRLKKLSAMFEDITPTANEGDEGVSLMKILPVRQPKKRKHKKAETSGTEGTASFLEASSGEEPAASGQPLLEAPVQQPQPQQQQQPAAAAAQPVAAAAAPTAAAPSVAVAAAPPTLATAATAAPATPAPTEAAPAATSEQGSTIFGSSQTTAPAQAAAPEAASAPAASPAPLSPEAAAAPAQGAAAASSAAPLAAETAPTTPSTASAAAPAGTAKDEVKKAGKDGKGVPIRQKVQSMAIKLRMFEVHEEELGYTADISVLEKTVKAGYTDITDKILVAWAILLPQAFVVTTFKFFSLLLPNPVVDFAEFYNATMAEDGSITEGFEGEPPVNHKLLVDRFSTAVDDAYKDAWRRVFSVVDDLGLDGYQPPAVQPVTGTPLSALEEEAGVVRPHSFVSEEPEEYSVAIVSSNDGLSVADLEKFADTAAVNRSSVEALKSAGFAAMPNLTGIVSLGLACAAVALLQ